MKKQTFQHAELRDEHNEIIQEGTYGKYSDFSNEQNSGFIDYVMNNLEWLRKYFDGYAKISDVEKDFLKKTDTPKIDLTGYYNKAETDKKYQPKGDYATKEDITKVGADVKGIENTKADKSALIGLASTEYVDGRIKHVIGTAPEALDTLGEIATVLTTNKDKIGTIINQISTKADKGTVENALMGKANNNEVYTKEEVNTYFQSKGDYVYKEEYDSDQNNIYDLVDKKAYETDVYTKDEVDEKLKSIPKVDTSEFVKMKNGHIILGDYEIWIEWTE